MVKRFTGWHMLGLMVGFFGVVIAVNLVMARYALSTFGGTVVDNSYVASQRFNSWLAEARDQKALGWTAEPGVDARRRVTLAVSGRDGQALGDLKVRAVAEHPLGRAPAVPLTFVDDGQGRYRSRVPLPPGRWIVRFEAQQGMKKLRWLESLE